MHCFASSIVCEGTCSRKPYSLRTSCPSAFTNSCTPVLASCLSMSTDTEVSLILLVLFLVQCQVHSNMCATRRSSNISLTHEFSWTLIWYCHIVSRRTEESTVVGDSSGNQGLDSQQYDIDIIKAATNYFDHGNKLGEGGFGPVYKVLFMFSLRLLFWCC